MSKSKPTFRLSGLPQGSYNVIGPAVEGLHVLIYLIVRLDKPLATNASDIRETYLHQSSRYLEGGSMILKGLRGSARLATSAPSTLQAAPAGIPSRSSPQLRRGGNQFFNPYYTKSNHLPVHDKFY